MVRVFGWMKWIALISFSGTLFSAGGCLPPNFFSTLLGDTIVTGITSAVLGSVLTSVGL